MEPREVIEKLENRFKQSYEEVLLTTVDGNHFTYGSFWANAVEISQKWEKSGVKRGDNVAIVLPNCAALLICYLACAINGFVANPINPGLSKKTITDLLENVSPSIVVREPPALENNNKTVSRNDIRVDSGGNASFYVMYTSGTTGKEKGICLGLGAAIGCADAFSKMAKMDGNTRNYHVLPMFYNAGIINSFLAPMMAGGRVIEGPQFSPVSMLVFWKFAIKQKANTLCLTPTIASGLCRMSRDPIVAKENVVNFHSIISSGSTLYVEIRNQFLSIFGLPLQDCYGITELGGPITLQTKDDALTRIDSGKCLPDVQIDLRPSEVGESELWIRSPYLMKGYIEDGQRLLPLDDKGYFKTGDLASIERGCIAITGRSKDIIIRGGANINPSLLEEELRKVTGVKEVGVIGVRDEFWGEKVIICVLPSNLQDWSKLVSDIRSHIEKNFSHPIQADKLVLVNDFPRSLIGKIKKNVLRDEIEQLTLLEEEF